MSGTLAIVVFFTGLLFIILIHEAGHYLIARAYGFKVEEYFVGFGPKLWSFKRKDIEYGVKALPLGGYVKIAGMNPYEPVALEDQDRAYGSKPIWQRAMVILAGPGSHFIVAAILFASWLFFFGDPRTPTPYITSVATTLERQPVPAAVAAGLQPGDRIVGVGDVTDPTREELLKYTTAHVGEPVVVHDRARSPDVHDGDHPRAETRSAARRSDGSVSYWVRSRWARSPPWSGA